VIFMQFAGLITTLDSITSIELTHTVITTATATTAAAAVLNVVVYMHCAGEG
jgi:hypothetical protein